MNKPIMLRDVMNSKSSNHMRHSINAYNVCAISKYYAIESRLYNSVWDEEKNKYVKGPLWLTNIMVFDFDFDESHFPNVKDHEKKLKQSLETIKSLLGNPRYIIKNKPSNKFSNEQIERYFTKTDELGNKAINLPKQYGCQVVYELSESILSQYPEMVNLYRDVRMQITKMVDADINFKGHMFKNYMNKDIFDIFEESDKEFAKLNIIDLAEKYCNGYTKEKINAIKQLKPFERLSDKLERITAEQVKHKIMGYRLMNKYAELNTWKSEFFKNKSNQLNQITSFKSESRNETLFNFMKMLTLDQLESLRLEDVLKINLFDRCTIQDALPENEFESTKQSVIQYVKNNGEIVHSNTNNKVDSRVIKIDQLPYDDTFIDSIKEKLEKAKSHAKSRKFLIKLPTLSRAKRIELYNLPKIDHKNISEDKIIDVVSKYLANLFMVADPIAVLSNSASLMSIPVCNWVVNAINNELNLEIKNWQIENIIWGAVFYTHFKLYHTIKRKSKASSIKRSQKSRNLFNIKGKKYGLYHKGNIKNFCKYINLMKRDNMLKITKCGRRNIIIKPMPISYYQQLFHINNTLATRFVRRIKQYLKNEQTLSKNIISTKNKNTSNLNLNLIKIYFIFYGMMFNDINSIKLFICKIYLVYVKLLINYNIITITSDNNFNNKFLFSNHLKYYSHNLYFNEKSIC